MAASSDAHDDGEGRRAAIVIGLTAIVGLTVAGLLPVREGMEEDLASRGNAALVEAGLDDVQVELDGRDVRLSGVVDDADDVARAREVVASEVGVRVVDATGVEVSPATGSGGGEDGTGGPDDEPTAAPTDADGTPTAAEDESSGGDEGATDEDDGEGTGDDGSDPAAPDGREDPTVEVVATSDGLRLVGSVGDEDEAADLRAAAVAAVGEDRVTDELSVDPAVATLAEERRAGLDPLVAWVAASAGEPWTSGVGFALVGPHLQFFGDVTAEARSQAEAAGPTVVGEDGTLDLADLVVVDPEDGENGFEGVVVRHGDVHYGPPVHFDFGSYHLGHEDVPRINAILDVLREEGITEVAVVGFTDAVGSVESNLVLSRRRAERVAHALARVLPDLDIEVIGRGEEALEENPAASRRVEVYEPVDEG